MSRLAVITAALLVAALALDAGANGRPPGTSTIHFRQGNDSDIVAGMTFGLVISHDGGATWQWMCEKAVGYGGMYDPIYAYSQSGAIFATTFDGLKVNRDGCTFAATPPGTTFVSQNTLGSDHAFYFTAADPNDAKIYKSTDDGMTFPTSAAPGQNNDWWDSIVVAKSDASRVYLSGYRFVMTCDANSPTPGMTCSLPTDCQDAAHLSGSCENQKDFLLFESTNGGASYTALPAAGLTTSVNSAVDFVGTSPTDENLLYARVSVENGTVGDGLYKLEVGTDTTWTKILAKGDTLVFLARGNGDIVAATPTLGAWVSSNQGATWTALAGPPHINCLAESSAGVVFACTQNYGTPPNIPSDGYGIMKTSDLATWTGVLRYQDIAGPVACDPGTAQHDMCVGTPINGVWCGLRQQLGITSNAIDCAALGGDGAPDAGSGSGGGKGKGCCDSGGGGGAPALVLASLVAGALLLRRGGRKPA
jgi:hypothetical protein